MEQFENKAKPNLNETEPVNLRSSEEVQETMISIHADERTSDVLIKPLLKFKDVFAWSYDDMPRLSVNLVVHKLPTYPGYPPIQQKQRKFKTDVSDKIKVEVTNQLKAGVIRVVRYTTSLANVVLVPKKDGKTRSFVECYAGYHQVLMDEEDGEKTASTIPWLLKNDVAIRWIDECQEAFDKIKEYLSNLPVLVPPEPGRPLFLYLTVLKSSLGCVLWQHDVTGEREEQALYYLSKKFTSYEAKYTLLERTCCSLTWVAQKLRHYLLAYTNYIITRLDPLKYIFQKPMPMGRIAKWQILLTEFDIFYVTRMTMKAQALADYLAENPIYDEYQPLSVGIGAILISPTGQHYPSTAQLQIFCTNNTAEYKACIMGMNMEINLDVEELLIMGDSDLIIRQAQGEWETRDIKLLPYRQHVEDLSKWFKSIEFRYIP
ncbi:uncharacterized protein [Nicotiana sylvestris]|uniref:uncharacterized protein n=1 Tax=Nicotiana sylvestris TaxID=4096 RepID=UPI00388C88D9